MDLKNLSDSVSIADDVLVQKTNTTFQNSSIFMETEDVVTTFRWYRTFEAALVGIVCLIGLIGNVVVLHGAVKAKRFPKHNVYLFFGLSLSDFLTCLIHGPCLIYIIFHTARSPDIVCELWMFSFIFVIIAIATNTVIAFERRMIMYNFQGYLKLFTKKRALVTVILVWTFVTCLFISLYKGLLFTAVFHSERSSCVLETTLFKMTKIHSLVFRSAMIVCFGVAPVVVQAICYIAIVLKVYKAELLQHDRLDENIIYTRITGIAFARVLVTVTCLFPVMICFAIGPVFPDVYYTNVRFLNDLIVLNSAISPFITLHDVDFKEIFVWWSWRYCTGLKRKLSKKNSRKSQIITSADMKTFGLS